MNLESIITGLRSFIGSLNPVPVLIVIVVLVLTVFFLMSQGGGPVSPGQGNVTPGGAGMLTISESEEEQIKEILTTDANYSELVDIVGDTDSFEVTEAYPLKPLDVVTGSTYLEGKLENYVQYIPYLQKLALSDNTEIIRLDKSQGKERATLYSIMDRVVGKSLLLILLIDIDIEAEFTGL